MRNAFLLTLLAWLCSQTGADVVFTQPPSPAGGVIASAWVDPTGSDADMYSYDSFILGSNQAVTAIRWRGGYALGAPYGHVFDFSVAFYESIAGGSQPHCNNPDSGDTIYLVKYFLGSNAGETYVGTYGGTAMYDYLFTLPTSFQALANTKYWVKVEGSQSTYPDWGLSVGTLGDGQHFQYSTGNAHFYFAQGDTAFALIAAAMVLGDLNCDGRVDFFDIDPFVQLLGDPAGWQAANPGCNLLNGDCNGDGVVDFHDIDPFVACLMNGACP